MEFAVLCFYRKLLGESVGESVGRGVFLGGAGEDEDVIEVEDDPVQHVMENIINQSLEHRGVGKAKGYDQVLIVATGRVEGSLPFVTFPYLHQVVGVLWVQLGEHISPLEWLEDQEDDR